MLAVVVVGLCGALASPFVAVVLADGGCSGSPSGTTVPPQPVADVDGTVVAITTIGNHPLDVDDIRARLQREIDAENTIDGDPYRIHSLEFDGSQLTLVMDLQFTPKSEAWLRSDAAAWTDMVLACETGEQYVSDLPVNIRTSLWTVFSEDEVITWGSYRVYDERVLGAGDTGVQKFSHNGGGEWAPGTGVELLR